MMGALTNHLWQSTLFAGVAGLLTLAFRNSRAEVRYWLWFSASLKFFVPFSLLISLGSELGWAPVAQSIAPPAVSFTMLQVEQMAQPFARTISIAQSTTGAAVDWLAVVAFGIWSCGFAAITAIRVRGWLRIRAAVRFSTPMDIPAQVEVRSSSSLLEPGVIGLFRPVLLFPEDIAGRLTPLQLKAVLAHELMHVRRGDNLTSAIHMIAEAVFWFHPFVWWIGARLLEERERACDESVLSMGCEPSDYAEGILAVCKCYLESPLPCVSGVTGSNLKKRLLAILTGRVPGSLGFAKKLALTVAGVTALAMPIGIGIIGATHIRAQSADVATAKFETASITSCEAFRRRTIDNLSPGKFHSGCTTVQRFIQQAYGAFVTGHENLLSSVTVTGGRAWTDSAFYQIDAEAAGNQSQAMMNGPMLRALLEDRFKLKIHRETREVPLYALTVANGGSKMQPFRGSCVAWPPIDDGSGPGPWDFYHPPPPAVRCGGGKLTSSGLDLQSTSTADLRFFLSVALDRAVTDETGITGRFDLHLELPAEDLGFLKLAHGVPALSDPASPAPDPAFVSAIRTAIGKVRLELEPSRGRGEFIVIDQVERPSSN